MRVNLGYFVIVPSQTSDSLALYEAFSTSKDVQIAACHLLDRCLLDSLPLFVAGGSQTRFTSCSLPSASNFRAFQILALTLGRGTHWSQA